MYHHYYNGWTEFFIIFGTIILVALLVAAAVGLALYILESIGLYHIARCRGIENPFLAWIPIARMYLLGSVADQIERHEGRTSRYSLILLICGCVAFGLGVITGLTESVGIFSFGAIIVSSVFTYLSYYRIFKAHAPEKATLFLVLSILFGLGPVFLFAVKNRVPTDMAPPPQYCGAGNSPYPPRFPNDPGRGAGMR